MTAKKDENSYKIKISWHLTCERASLWILLRLIRCHPAVESQTYIHQHTSRRDFRKSHQSECLESHQDSRNNFLCFPNENFESNLSRKFGDDPTIRFTFGADRFRWDNLPTIVKTFKGECTVSDARSLNGKVWGRLENERWVKIWQRGEKFSAFRNMQILIKSAWATRCLIKIFSDLFVGLFMSHNRLEAYTPTRLINRQSFFFWTEMNQMRNCRTKKMFAKKFFDKPPKFCWLGIYLTRSPAIISWSKLIFCNVSIAKQACQRFPIFLVVQAAVRENSARFN